MSSAFQHQQTIPDRYTCKGDDVNPPLQFLEVPDNAQSLVLIVDDPDAPGGTWDHWVVFNIEPRTLGVEENSMLSSGTEGKNSWGNRSYGGPCPPSGTHRYFFKLYALDKLLDINDASDKKAVEKAMQEHIIDTAELIGLVSK